MIDFIFSVAAILITLSYLATDILILRVISLLGALIYAVGGIQVGYDSPGMSTLIFFSLLNFFINAVQTVRLLLDRKPIFLEPSLQRIYSLIFQNMTPKEFLKLYKMAKKNDAKKGDELIKANQHVPNLLFLTNGEVSIVSDKEVKAKLSSGHFLGEMSYLRNGFSNADVIVESPTAEYIFWEKNVLANLEHSNTGLYTKFKHTIAIDLINKIEKS